MSSSSSASRRHQRAKAPRRSRGGNSRLRNATYGPLVEIEAQREVIPPRGHTSDLDLGVLGASPALCFVKGPELDVSGAGTRARARGQVVCQGLKLGKERQVVGTAWAKALRHCTEG